MTTDMAPVYQYWPSYHFSTCPCMDSPIINLLIIAEYSALNLFHLLLIYPGYIDSVNYYLNVNMNNYFLGYATYYCYYCYWVSVMCYCFSYLGMIALSVIILAINLTHFTTIITIFFVAGIVIIYTLYYYLSVYYSFS